MADQLLSIQDSTLTAIANSIRSKGNTNSSLEFPTDFVSALQAITTEATVTPKITAQQKVLTPNDTQFSIDAGFHDGTGTVSIQFDTTNNSANPTSSQQTYYPSSGKFFSSFSVGGTGSGKVMATGEITLSGQRNFTISGLSFTPEGIAVALKQRSGSSNFTYVGSVWVSGIEPNRNLLYCYKGKADNTLTSYKHDVSSGSIVFGNTGDYSYWNGTYYYVVWGS